MRNEKLIYLEKAVTVICISTAAAEAHAVVAQVVVVAVAVVAVGVVAASAACLHR